MQKRQSAEDDRTVMEVVQANYGKADSEWTYEVVQDPEDPTREAVKVVWEDEACYAILCDRMDDYGKRSCDVRQYDRSNDELVHTELAPMHNGYVGIGFMLSL